MKTELKQTHRPKKQTSTVNTKHTNTVTNIYKTHAQTKTRRQSDNQD